MGAMLALTSEQKPEKRGHKLEVTSGGSFKIQDTQISYKSVETFEFIELIKWMRCMMNVKRSNNC